jgi:hypothetical protein
MERLRSLIISVFSSWIVLAAILVLPVRAGAIGFQPVSPEELKMTSEPKAPGAAAVILYRQVDRDDNGRTSHEDNYFRIKILTEEGRSHANIDIPFDKENVNIVNLRARTIRPDGTIANFDGKTFDHMIAKSKSLKYFAKTFTLPDVQVGSIIEYFYTIDYSDQFIFDSHWILSDELYTRHAKFSLKPYTSDYSTINLRWTWHDVREAPKQGPDHIVRLEVSDIPAFESEDFMPPENELKSRVDFIYSDESVDSDQAKFWKHAGKKLNGKVESFIDKRKAMEQAVSEIVSPSDTPEVKAQKIYARVQQLRNTWYEVEKTDQEKKRNNEKDLTNVEDVWKRGYGDGKQLTWLFLALAKVAGLDASGVWVSDRDDYFFNPVTMEDRKLNDNVVLLHFKDKDVYCDPGAFLMPYGILPWQETSVRGLRLDKDGGTWITTTVPDSKATRITRKADLKLTPDDGSLTGKLTVTYTGLEASARRVEQRNVDETARKKFLEDEIRESVPVAIEVELTNSPDWKSSSTPLVAEFNLTVTGWASAAGRRAMLPIGLFSAPEKHLFDHAHRVHPIYYRYPNGKVDDVTIELPDGWSVSSLPPETNQVQEIIGYVSKVEANKQSLHISRMLSADLLLLDTKYYSALQNFYRMVRTSDEQQIILLPGTATASR